MSIPTYEEVMLPLLEVIYDGNIYTNKECEQQLSKIFKKLARVQKVYRRLC